MKTIQFIVQGSKLKGNIFYPSKLKEKNPVILFIHGWTGEKIRSYQYCNSLIQLGYICFVFDMRGHGESEGDRNILTPKDFLNDVLAAYDYLTKLPEIDIHNINIAGASFGSYLGLLLSTKRNIKRMALRVPADYPNEAFNIPKSKNSGSNNMNLVSWRAKPKKANETFALHAMSKFKNEILIIESEKDESVPHDSIQNYIKAFPYKQKLTHIVVKGSPHSTVEGPFRNKVTQILTNWFGKWHNVSTTV